MGTTGIKSQEPEVKQPMKRIIQYIIILICISCSPIQNQRSLTVTTTSDIPKQLNLAQRSFNDTSKNVKIQGDFKGFDPAKPIFNQLRGELKASKTIVYQFTWQNDMPTITGNFRAIVFDKTSGKKFYCSGSGSSKMLDIRSTPTIQDSLDEKVLNSYLSGDHENIKSLQRKFISVEIGEDYTIYEIVLQNPRVKIQNFSSVAVIL